MLNSFKTHIQKIEFRKSDWLIVLLLLSLVVFGRMLNFWLSNNALAFKSNYDTNKSIVIGMLFNFTYLSVVALSHFKNRHTEFKGICAAVSINFIITLVISNFSLINALVFCVSSFAVVCMTVFTMKSANMKRYLLLIALMYLVFGALICFMNSNRLSQLVHHNDLVGSEWQYTRGDEISRFLRDAHPALIGSASYSFDATWTTDFLYSFIRVDSYFTLTYVLLRFGVIPAAAIVFAYLVLCIKLWLFASRQNDKLHYIYSFAVAFGLTASILLYVFSNFGFAYINVNLPFLSGNLKAFMVNAIVFTVSFFIFERFAAKRPAL